MWWHCGVGSGQTVWLQIPALPLHMVPLTGITSGDRPGLGACFMEGAVTRKAPKILALKPLWGGHRIHYQMSMEKLAHLFPVWSIRGMILMNC